MLKETKSLDLWLDSFRRRRDGRQLDVVLLQETRAVQRWSTALEHLWLKSWGYAPQRMTSPLSYWPEVETPAAGVAILLSPTSALQDVVPWRRQDWSAHFVAITGKMSGEVVTVINIYGPVYRPKRQAFYQELANGTVPPGLVLLGGDFNCTLDDELDRSHPAGNVHHSPALVSLLRLWKVVDSVSPEMLNAHTTTDIRRFYAEYHTYAYSVRDGELASARLDRWYVSAAHHDRTQQVVVEPPHLRSDHDAIRLRLGPDKAKPTSTGNRTPALRYPIPKCAAKQVYSVGEALLSGKGRELAKLPAPEAAAGWDRLKLEARRTSLATRRECLATVTQGRRDKIKRLNRALKDAKFARHLVGLPMDATVDEITRGMNALALDPARRHAGPAAESAKHLFRRIHSRFGRRASAQLPTLEGCTVGPADRVAQDWTPITQRPPCDPLTQDLFFAALPKKPRTRDLSSIDEDFTTAEVASAIRACPRGKACGPDGLPNDWYRDHEEDIASVLAPLFSLWYRSGVLPPSFKAATIFCIPKKAKPETGLNFRPIALLNTDYKIYARVILNRIRNQVPELVAATQHGFVAGRQVHDALDIWSAIRQQTHAGAIPSTAMAVLLDFAKAYDTLDRRFLQLSLTRHGFTPNLVQAVHAMHLNTTAAYIAEQEVSVEIDITTGIRQGCPLAPTLFVLAVDTLYELIEMSPHLHGVPVADDVRVSIVGFADDTTVYLQKPEDALVLIELLDRFALVSGLAVNISKSIAVCLDAGQVQRAQRISSFPVANADQLVRYLGGQISTLTRTDAVWDLTVQQVHARLHLALIKTTDLLQRIQICRAVLIPKILFVARHSWPTAAQVRRLQVFVDNYAWHGVLSAHMSRGRTGASQAIAHAPREDGGFQIPDVRDELLLLSATTLQRWSSATGGLASRVGRLLAASALSGPEANISPARGPQTQPRLFATIATSGLAVLRDATCQPRTPEESASIGRVIGSAGKAPPSAGTWIDGKYRRDYSNIHTDLKAIQRLQRERAGRLHVHSLLASPILGRDLLLNRLGRPLTAEDLPGLHLKGVTVGEMVDFTWHSSTTISFRRRGSSYPDPGDRSFRTLQDQWRLLQRQGRLLLLRATGTDSFDEVGEVTSLRRAETLARRASGRKRLQFQPHPRLSPVLPLWGSATRLFKQHLRRSLSDQRAARIESELAARAARAFEASDDYGSALEEIECSSIHSLPHSSSRQRLLFHHVKSQRLTGWDKIHNCRGCPHCPTIGPSGGTTFHIVWECPAAQQIWDIVKKWWMRLGLWPVLGRSTSRSFLQAVFSLRLPYTPSRVWEFASLHQGHRKADDPAADPFPVLQVVWQQLVLESLVFFQAWRTKCSDENTLWSVKQAAVLHDASCQHALRVLSTRVSASSSATHQDAMLTEELRASFWTQFTPSTLPQEVSTRQDCEHLLFFDGGIHATSETAAFGAVLVEVNTTSSDASIVWTSAGTLAAPSSTLHQALYKGLIVGLRAARERHLTQLEVIGCNALVLRQLRDHRPPRNRALANLTYPHVTWPTSPKSRPGPATQGPTTRWPGDSANSVQHRAEKPPLNPFVPKTAGLPCRTCSTTTFVHGGPLVSTILTHKDLHVQPIKLLGFTG